MPVRYVIHVMKILGVENLSVSYNGVKAVDNVSFDLHEGDLMGVLGANGAGKTTMFRAIMDLQKHTGNVKFFEQDQVSKIFPLIGYVQQKVQFEPNFPMTSMDAVKMCIKSEKTINKARKLIKYGEKKFPSDKERITNALKQVGMLDFENVRIGTMSGGELQKIFISMALVNKPILLLLDEPVTGIDAGAQIRFYDLLTNINKSGTSILWSSHDMNAVEERANIVGCMKRSMIFHGSKIDFFKNPDLIKEYTEAAMHLHIHDDNMH